MTYSTDSQGTDSHNVQRVVACAQGKINLHLGVGDVREDGYHDLVSVFQAVNLTETVTLTSPDSDKRDSDKHDKAVLTVTGRDAHLVPTDESNLAWRAVAAIEAIAQRRAVAEDARELPFFPHIHIDKEVPVAGGMAGGSADAAAALVAANEYYATHVSREELLDIGATLGADVPFCVHGATAVGTGRGEHVREVPTRGELHWVIVPDSRGLSTPAVFRTLDEQRASCAKGTAATAGVKNTATTLNALSAANTDNTENAPHSQEPSQAHGMGHYAQLSAVDDLLHAVNTGDPQRVAPLLHNDLQAAALTLLPSLRDTLDAAYQAGALAALVSGSGPSVAILCATESHAQEAAARLSAPAHTTPAQPLPTVLTSSPAPAARLLS